MKKLQFLILLLPYLVKPQSHSLIGYWHNWNASSAPYIPLTQVDSRYNVIEVSFAEPLTSTNMNMQFTPDGVTPAVLTSQVQQLQAQGRKVLISIGGANAVIDLNSTVNKTAFISTMTSILTTYGFDGIDIDIEHGSSVTSTGGTLNAPTNIATINLIDAIKQIMINYRAAYNKKMMLTMAPETAFVQGGKSAFGGIWGGYLPIIHGLRDSLDILQVQLYNSGSMIANDNNSYSQGTADFIVSMTEMLIQGFNTSGGMFVGLPANKIAIGLPACPLAAGGGYTSPAVVKSAIDYLRGLGPKPGSYTRVSTTGYPNLLGMMTWSINWDAVANCASSYEYANSFQTIFMTPTHVQNVSTEYSDIKIFPNPSSGIFKILRSNSSDYKKLKVYNCLGEVVAEASIGEKSEIDLSNLASGIYTLATEDKNFKLIKE
ncbi:MAG: glycosyl hydrolase family 18 protein [Sediminibacterium sp.]|nr:glycosyl hydrolase family 18 protein [Sediminibacterium sp.]